jgi:hypothetical protein
MIFVFRRYLRIERYRSVSLNDDENDEGFLLHLFALHLLAKTAYTCVSLSLCVDSALARALALQRHCNLSQLP